MLSSPLTSPMNGGFLGSYIREVANGYLTREPALLEAYFRNLRGIGV